MKKYYQLLLVIVSVISVVSLVVYRNEYNRLRYVLEVLNFFGKPAEANVQLQCFDTNKTIYDENIYNIPAPSWQRIDNLHYVYSAYWKEIKKGGEVTAIAVGLSGVSPALMCQLWFPNKDKPVTGKFRYSVITSEGNQDYTAYKFTCKVQLNFGIPFGVVFYNNQMKKPAQATKIPVQNVKFSQKPDSNLACVLPQLTNRKIVNLVEFLNFHQIVGITEFIFYDDGHVPSTFYNQKLGFHLTSLAWNFPFDQNVHLNRDLIENDCLLRTTGRFESVYVMNLDEFIVPTHHTTIAGIIYDFDATKRIHQFQLSILEFCIDYEDKEDNPKNQVILHKLHYKSRSTSTKFNIFRPGIKVDSTVSTQVIDSNIVAVHKYIKCFENEKSTQLSQSSSILRFNGDFIKSLFYELWVAGKLSD